MSLSWTQRKTRLASLLKSRGDEDADGIAIDRLMHGQRVIGKTSKTTDVDALRFQDQDLDTVGTLDYGQFGVIDVVVCRLDSKVYVRKSVDKRFALRSRDQCSPQFERDILLRAAKTDSPWAPHLLCAFQTPTHLNLVMNYAEGGNLWDVLESNPDGTVPESDLRWWVPQVVSAIHWCHTQGFAHRDVKPHNFVLTPTAHVLLIDFGSAAPLLPPRVDGSQLIPQRYCLVPCGTCDYISPEILKAHEEALVALEMEDDDNSFPIERKEADGYGAETDWWSLGAMLYEMVYGVAPFFAPDIKQTYTNIMNYERSLKFDRRIGVSNDYRNFLTRLLTTAERRLGRRNIMEITDHPLFDGVDWTTLPIRNCCILWPDCRLIVIQNLPHLASTSLNSAILKLELLLSDLRQFPDAKNLYHKVLLSQPYSSPLQPRLLGVSLFCDLLLPLWRLRMTNVPHHPSLVFHGAQRLTHSQAKSHLLPIALRRLLCHSVPPPFTAPLLHLPALH